MKVEWKVSFHSGTSHACLPVSAKVGEDRIGLWVINMEICDEADVIEFVNIFD